MISEYHKIFYLNYICLVMGVIVSNILENLKFDDSLIIEFFLIADDFEGGVLLSLMVHYFQDLSEGTSSERFDYFIPVGYMISQVVKVVSPFWMFFFFQLISFRKSSNMN